jgi:glycosyltransferase involved in cell wall biosynthesis
LTLGYNTAVFCALLRWKGIPNIINMDGIEWSRAKWGPAAKAWFRLNERAGCWLGDHLVADHPQIKLHLQSYVPAEKISTIAYGADAVTSACVESVEGLGLRPGKFLTLIARPEPENSILEVVRGFSLKPRGYELVVLGHYDDCHAYHRTVKSVASAEVKFVGGIYDKKVVRALRFFSTAYVHGHQVGGTNPSLVEALGAGNPIIAHDNRFNRWVADSGAAYFDSAGTFSDQLDQLLSHPDELLALQALGKHRFESMFVWDGILTQYEELLRRHLPRKVQHVGDA